MYVKRWQSANGIGPLQGSPAAVQPRGIADWEWHGRKSSYAVLPYSDLDPLQFPKEFENVKILNEPQLQYSRTADASEAGFKRHPSKLLGLLASTAICANDISGSIYYSMGPLVYLAGSWAPLCYVLVTLVLGLFRNIYAEVVNALPLNGGTYTATINLTSKRLAIVASILSVISYIATVCTNASTAVAFFANGAQVLEDDDSTRMFISMGVIVVMMIVMIIGIRESSWVSIGIFVLHMVTEFLMVVAAIIVGANTGFGNFGTVMHMENPNPVAYSIFFGWATGMLGITGFETSANFVEEQRPGIFPKTLLNMWLIAGIFNPLLTIAAFIVIPTDQLLVIDPNSFLLELGINAAPYIGGNWLKYLIIVDSVSILTGTVLTGYVGVTGLFKRLCNDECVPKFFCKTNPITNANYPIPIMFCALCVALIGIANGDIDSFNYTYTIAFLIVMSLFGTANLILKKNRHDLSVTHSVIHARWWVVCIAITCTMTALVLNIIISPIALLYFSVYFFGFLFIIGLYFIRSGLLRGMLYLVEDSTVEKRRPFKWVHDHCVRWISEIEDTKLVFLSRRLDLRDLNKAVEYVLHNESNRHLVIVHGYNNIAAIPRDIPYKLEILKQIHPTIRIDLLFIEGSFCPGFIRTAEAITQVNPTRMFVASLSTQVKYNLAELGSLRIIMRRNDRGMTPLLQTAQIHPMPDVLTPVGSLHSKEGYTEEPDDVQEMC